MYGHYNRNDKGLDKLLGYFNTHTNQGYLLLNKIDAFAKQCLNKGAKNENR